MTSQKPGLLKLNPTIQYQGNAIRPFGSTIYKVPNLSDLSHQVQLLNTESLKTFFPSQYSLSEGEDPEEKLVHDTISLASRGSFPIGSSKTKSLHSAETSSRKSFASLTQNLDSGSTQSRQQQVWSLELNRITS